MYCNTQLSQDKTIGVSHRFSIQVRHGHRHEAHYGGGPEQGGEAGEHRAEELEPLGRLVGRREGVRPVPLQAELGLVLRQAEDWVCLQPLGRERTGGKEMTLMRSVKTS